MTLTSDILALVAPRDFETHAASEWKEAAVEKLTEHTTITEVDMAGTRTMDSGGISALLALNDVVARRNGEVRLINPTPVVTQLLELTRLHRVFVITKGRAAPQPYAERPILVVEDEAIIRTVAKMSLTPLGRTILFAENGEEALVIARRDHPAVILLDSVMPLMDGAETLRQLKGDPSTRDIPVIIVSANKMIANGDCQSFAGASCFISKPFSPTTLRGEVHNLIQAQRELAAV